MLALPHKQQKPFKDADGQWVPKAPLVVSSEPNLDPQCLLGGAWGTVGPRLVVVICGVLRSFEVVTGQVLMQELNLP